MQKLLPETDPRAVIEVRSLGRSIIGWINMFIVHDFYDTYFILR